MVFYGSKGDKDLCGQCWARENRRTGKEQINDTPRSLQAAFRPRFLACAAVRFTAQRRRIASASTDVVQVTENPEDADELLITDIGQELADDAMASIKEIVEWWEIQRVIYSYWSPTGSPVNGDKWNSTRRSLRRKFTKQTSCTNTKRKQQQPVTVLLHSSCSGKTTISLRRTR
jgi:hypothetical protein